MDMDVDAEAAAEEHVPSEGGRATITAQAPLHPTPQLPSRGRSITANGLLPIRSGVPSTPSLKANSYDLVHTG